MMRTWMRWSVVAASVGVGLLPGTGRAQDEAEAEMPSRRTLILALPMNQVGVGVEHAVGSHVALSAAVHGQLRLSGFHYEGASPESTTKHWALGFEPGVHFYLAGRAPEGLWVGPHLEAEVSEIGGKGFTRGPPPENGLLDTEHSSTLVSYGGSVHVGYTAILSPGLSLQVALGLAASTSRSMTSTREGGNTVELPPEERWYVWPRMSLGVGWAF